MSSRFEAFEPLPVSAEWFRIEAHFNYDRVYFDFSEWSACPDSHRRAAAVAIYETRHIAPVEDALERLVDLVFRRLDPVEIDAILTAAERIADRTEQELFRDAEGDAAGIEVREALNELLVLVKLAGWPAAT